MVDRFGLQELGGWRSALSLHPQLLGSRISDSNMPAGIDRDQKSASTSVADAKTMDRLAAKQPRRSYRLNDVGNQQHLKSRFFSSPSEAPEINRILCVRESDLIVALSPSPSSSIPTPVIRMINMTTWKRVCTRILEDEQSRLADILSDNAGGGLDAEDDDGLVTDLTTAGVADEAAAEVGFQELRLSEPVLFPIRQLKVNSSGRLLAIVGDHNVVVAFLPLYSRFAGPVLDVKSVVIGKVHYANDSANRIVKVLWHAMSEKCSHLMVLSSNAVLRIYDIENSALDPESSYAFTENGELALGSPVHRTTPVKRNEAGLFTPSDFDRKRVLHEDRIVAASSLLSGKKEETFLAEGFAGGLVGERIDEFEAVSFDMGTGTGWGPFTAYCLMKNGDVLAMCPVAPQKSRVSRVSLLSLKSLNHHNWINSDPDSEPLERQYYWRNRWIEDLLGPDECLDSQKLEQMSQPSVASSSEPTNGSFYDPMPQSKQMLQKPAPTIGSIPRQFRPSVSSPLAKFVPTLDEAATQALDAASSTKLSSEFVVVSSQVTSTFRPAVQGPFRYTDLSAEDVESISTSDIQASDIAILNAGPLVIPAISFQNGTVRMFVEVESVQPTWVMSTMPDVASRGEFFLYEIIDLSGESEGKCCHQLLRLIDGEDIGFVALLADPKSPEVVYASHIHGTHLISARPWAEQLLSGQLDSSNSLSASEFDRRISRLMAEHKPSEVMWLVATQTAHGGASSPILGFDVITDLFLGYGYIVISDDELHCGALQLKNRLRSSAARSVADIKSKALVKTSHSGEPKPKVNESVKVTGKKPYAVLPLPSFQLEPFKIPDLALKSGMNVPRILVGNSKKSSIERPRSYPEAVLQEPEIAIRSLVQSIAEYRQHKEDIRSSILTLIQRMNEMTTMLSRQHNFVVQLLSENEKVLEQRNLELKERLEGVTKTQRKLDVRSTVILQMLRDQAIPELTDEERRWFSSLRQIQDKVTKLYPIWMQQQCDKGMQLVAHLTKDSQRRAAERHAMRIGYCDGLSTSQKNSAYEALSLEYKSITAVWKRFDECTRALKL